MPTKDEDFLQLLRQTFRDEAQEHLQTMATGLLSLEKTESKADRAEAISSTFRAAHSLKGAARAVEFDDIEASCQSLEDLFARWSKQDTMPHADEFDLAHRTLDTIIQALAAAALSSATASQETIASAAVATDAVERATGVVLGAARTPSTDETVRIAVSKLDARLLEAEEMLAVKLSALQRIDELRELESRFKAWLGVWASVEPAARALHEARGRGNNGPARDAGLVRVLDFVDWNVEQIQLLQGKVVALCNAARQERHVVDKLVDDLLEGSKQLLLLPFGSMSSMCPKLVRDLCRTLDKEADLVIEGEDVELDKRILEELKDPLVHLLRNCVDHGVESPSVRVAAGKVRRATITLVAAQADGNRVELTLSDDGAGIDLDQVKASAVQHGLLTQDVADGLTPTQAQELVFQAEVSTSRLITHVSGRGLGMAIVREKVEKLGGSVTLESQPGRGTLFRIVLPSMLATFRGITVRASERFFVIPTHQINRVARVLPQALQTVEGRAAVNLAGRTIALAQLTDVLALPAVPTDSAPGAAVPVVLLGTGDQCIAFAVDAVLDEQEVLVKRLCKPLLRVRNIAGATILSNGQVAPILNVADLLKSARQSAGAAPRQTQAAPAQQASRTILVAEDSITSRLLIKSILESAGHHVRTAADGMEAFTMLRAHTFDLLVSDVEMPRLNGFDLTARVRADKALAHLPVVLVTALESREDRERGIDVGANAYLVKSSFDQSDLIDTVRRLA